MFPEQVKLVLKKADHAADLPLPRYMTAGSSGMDLYAAVEQPLTVAPGERALVSAGIMAAVPPGYELQVRPRSGLAAKRGVGIVNSPGTIDADYRGEIKVILINFGSEHFTVQRGDRIAQLVLCPVIRADIIEMEILPETGRGSGGFGHTGS